MRSEGSYTRERLLPRPHMDVLINLGEARPDGDSVVLEV
jgi:hypothetical protein